jgi:hypothetical protein
MVGFILVGQVGCKNALDLLSGFNLNLQASTTSTLKNVLVASKDFA